MAASRTIRHRSGAADHVTLRRHNLSVVLRHLRRAGPVSRARIAGATGLNKATVSSLVADLIERGLVVEAEAEQGAVGRPGQLVKLDGARVCGMGAEINVDYLAVLALGLDGNDVVDRRVPLPAARLGVDAVLKALAELVSESLATLRAQGSQCVGLTVAVPGLARVDTGVIALAPNLGWTEVPVVERLRDLLPELGAPITLDNEANLAAIAASAEVRESSETGPDEVLLLTGAVGVGAGVVSEGWLLRGGHGFSGEVGHMPIGAADRTCGCGRHGCWETVVGLGRLLELAAAPDDVVHDPALDVVQRLAELTARAEAGDERTLEALDEVGRWLGIGASVLVNILNPDALVLGGYFAQMGPWLTDNLERELALRVIAPDAGGCRVVLSQLGFGAAVQGGAQTALDAVFSNPMLVGSVPDGVITSTSLLSFEDRPRTRRMPSPGEERCVTLQPQEAPR